MYGHLILLSQSSYNIDVYMFRDAQEQASRLEEERKGMETKLRNLQIQVDEGESEALRSV